MISPLAFIIIRKVGREGGEGVKRKKVRLSQGEIYDTIKVCVVRRFKEEQTFESFNEAGPFMWHLHG